MHSSSSSSLPFEIKRLDHVELPAPAGAVRFAQLDLEALRQRLGQILRSVRIDRVDDDLPHDEPAVLLRVVRPGTAVGRRGG